MANASSLNWSETCAVGMAWLEWLQNSGLAPTTSNSGLKLTITKVIKASQISVRIILMISSSIIVIANIPSGEGGIKTCLKKINENEKYFLLVRRPVNPSSLGEKRGNCYTTRYRAPHRPTGLYICYTPIWSVSRGAMSGLLLHF